MDLLLGASIIASFLAGIVALFAPCCITVLLPAYLASAFREKKRMLKMTFVFFAGIAVVLIPIGLGAAALAQVFRNFHEELYIVGGAFMVLLAVGSIAGKGIRLPFMQNVRSTGDLSHPKSVFTLGILSGAATSCCAPVLAGAMTLAVLSGGFWNALIVTFAYVFGMVFPLFIAAYFYDRWHIEKSRLIQGKLLALKLGRKEVSVHSTNLLAAVMFAVVGAVMLWLGLGGNAYWSPEMQVSVGQQLNTWSYSGLDALAAIPEAVWAVVIVGLFIWLLVRASKKENNR